ncbi:MAG: hypothetical protein WBB25_03460 [Sulfitobacter sp.]
MIGIEAVSSATVGAALMVLVQYAFKSVSSHLMSRDLVRYETLLARVDRERTGAYGDIWTLTGAFNLYGPETAPDLTTLQTKMRDWYFKHGQYMTPDVRDWYFCAMELLGAMQTAGVEPVRLPAIELYGRQSDTGAVLREALSRRRGRMDRSGLEKVPVPRELPGQATYQSKANQRGIADYVKQIGLGLSREDRQPKVADLIQELKLVLFRDDRHRPEVAEFAWLILQEVFSRLRTALTRDIGTRANYGRFSLS